MLAHAGLDRLSRHLMAKQQFELTGAGDQFVQIDTGCDAHLMQEMYQILAADVTGYRMR